MVPNLGNKIGTEMTSWGLLTLWICFRRSHDVVTQ